MGTGDIRDGLASCPGGSSNTPRCFMLRNQDKLQPFGPLACVCPYLYLNGLIDAGAFPI